MEEKIDQFELILVDINEKVCDAFAHHFAIYPNVKVVHSRFEEVEYFDCMVSAANSFGLMDGGISDDFLQIEIN